MEPLQFDSALAQGDKRTQRFQKQLAVFDVGVAKLRRNQKPYADLVILREPEGRVEVLRRKQGAYSGIKAVCFLICIGRDAPFGAKPRPAIAG